MKKTLSILSCCILTLFSCSLTVAQANAAAKAEEPLPFQAISLKDIANLDYKDEVAGDGKGGWSNLGPNNDLRNFPYRQSTFANVTFDLLAPAAHEGKAVLGLYCTAHVSSYPRNATATVNGLHGNVLYLLHTLGGHLPLEKKSVPLPSLTRKYPLFHLMAASALPPNPLATVSHRSSTN